VVHGTDKDLLTTTLVLAASAGVPVSVAIAGRRTEAVAVAALIAWALLEEALAGLLFLLTLVMGSGRLRSRTVRRGTIHGCAILCGATVLLPFARAAFIAAAAAATMSLTLTCWVLSLRVLALRRSILGLRL